MIDVLHWIGSKPLVISLLAQLIVLGVALKQKDKGQLAESGVLAGGLILTIVGIAMRPGEPVQLVPDILGTLAAVTFLVPAIKSLAKLRSGEHQPGQPREAAATG